MGIIVKDGCRRWTSYNKIQSEYDDMKRHVLGDLIRSLMTQQHHFDIVLLVAVSYDVDTRSTKSDSPR